jgi:FlaG protein
MSTDFNIKPVGAPVAAPIAQPQGDATQNAVATVLPAPQSVAAAEASGRTGNESDSVQVSLSNAAASNASAAAVSNEVVIDRDANAVVYQVVDNKTNQVVQQFPEEAVLRRRAYFHTLDLTKSVPVRLSATDLRA